MAAFIPGTSLLTAFGAMMIATAAAMIRGRRTSPRPREKLPILPILVEGLVVGFVTGLVGAGGGFLMVPALTLLGGLPMGAAVGTSLLVMALKSFAGLGGYLASVSLDWGLALAVTGAAIGGSIVGERLTGRIPHRALRQGFGYFVLATGTVFLLTQGPPGLRQTATAHPLATALLTAGVVVAGVTTVLLMRHRNRRRPLETGRQP